MATGRTLNLEANARAFFAGHFTACSAKELAISVMFTAHWHDSLMLSAMSI